jgi:hypothetical protein
MRHPTRLIIAAACALAAHAASAQQVWRCGSSYSQQPCPGGAQVDTSDGRSATQVAKSSSVAQSDMKLADKMEKERLEREKNAPKALVIGPQTPIKPAVEHPPTPKKPEQFVATSSKPKAKAKPKAKKKAAV